MRNFFPLVGRNRTNEKNIVPLVVKLHNLYELVL